MAEKIVRNVAFRVSEDLHHRVRAKLAERHENSWQALLVALLEDWTVGEREVSIEPPPPQISPELAAIRDWLAAADALPKNHIAHKTAEYIRSVVKTKP